MSERISVEPLEERRTRLFLSGSLPEAERLSMQERFFLDEEYFNQMRFAEAELLDEYVRGELPANEMEGARRYVTESSQRERLSFARALAASAAESSWTAAAEPGGTGRRWWLVAILAAAAAMLAWLVREILVLRGRLDRKAASVAEGPAFRIAAAIGGVARTKIPAGTRLVCLEVDLGPAGDHAPPYTVDVRTVAGETVWSQRADAAGQPPKVNVWLPADKLAPATYEAALAGVGKSGSSEPAGSLYFLVE